MILQQETKIKVKLSKCPGFEFNPRQVNDSSHSNQGADHLVSQRLIGLTKKKIEEKPRRWHEVLSEALWAYRVSKHGAIKVTQFELVYGMEAVIPLELSIQADRVIHQDIVSAEDYSNLMMDEIDELMKNHLRALREIEKEKLQVAKPYNKKVRDKSFQVGDLVWKTILPIGSHERRFGKWSPNWEGPYKVIRVVPGNAYMVEALDGRLLPKALNGRYLKKFHPSVWHGA
jgi:hypothetical protein